MNATNSTYSSGASTVTDSPWNFDAGWNWFIWNIFVWLFPLMGLVGAIANVCSFCVIVSNRKSFPYVTRQYLSIITMSDFVILGFVLTIQYFQYMSGVVKENAWSWYQSLTTKGYGVCIIYGFFVYYAAVGHPFFHLGLTVDRLVAVAAPMKAKLILTHKRSWVLLAVITAMALLLPVFYIAGRIWDDEKKCITKPGYAINVYNPAELYFFAAFLFPALALGTIAICSLLAWNNWSAQRMQTETGTASQQQQRISRQRQRSLVRTSLMLVFINLIFLGSSLPYTFAIYLRENFETQMGTTAYRIMLSSFNPLGFVFNALTWPVYFMGGNFRAAFSRMFLRFCPWDSTQPSTRTSSNKG